MAMSLGFHIVFASIGIAMPFFMALSHYRYLRTGKRSYILLTKAWSKGVAVFFAVGAVSGTVLSFELGLLWPGFMEHAGAIIGMPFSWEGAAFFLEAIAIGLFLYGWDRLRPWTHWFCGLVVGISGVLSGFFVICANGWMNSPAGFDWVNGRAVNIDPVAAMFNDAAFIQGLHMTVAAFQATGFAVAGLHALLLRRRPRSVVHRDALHIALVFAAVSSLIQPLVGHAAAQSVARRQPEKLAAMEAHFTTARRAPLLLGGIPDVSTGRVDYALAVPGGLSFLAFGDVDAEVQGLDAFPPDERPPVLITHLAFQTMVVIGSVLATISVVILFLLKRRSPLLTSRLFLGLLAALTPAGFIAIEAGWTVTEVGRQPWIIYRVLRTADAVTPMPGIVVSLVVFTVLYLILTVLLIAIMRRMIAMLHAAEKAEGAQHE